jgi:3-hydroxyisobutyrate dehydrogenase
VIGPGSTIGFIGTGVMGASMAGHLMEAGYSLRVFNRTPDRATALVDRGAVWCDSPEVVADGAAAVVTMLGYPSDVQDVYLGSGRLVASAEPGTLLIDMTTSSPVLAQRVHEAAAGAGARALDAPVSGGDVGAREARLTIMVGGDAEAFAEAEPLLRVMGPNVVLPTRR